MSVWELSDTAADERPAPRRPLLRSVPRPVARLAQVPFAGLMVLILAVGMIGLLLLNTHLQEQSLDMRRAQREANQLAYRLSDLEAQIHRANSPAQIAGRATELGMVPYPHANYVDLATGTVTGKKQRASADEIPALRTRSSDAPVQVPDATKPVDSKILPWFDLGSARGSDRTNDR